MVNYFDSLRGAIVMSRLWYRQLPEGHTFKPVLSLNLALTGYIVGIGEGLGSEWRGICYFD